RTFRRTQSMSLSGVKRTWPIALHMSAFDPKRTSTRSQRDQPRGDAETEGLGGLKLITPFSNSTSTSQKSGRPKDRAPHMRRRAAIETEAFFRLFEISSDNVDEIVKIDLGVWIE